MARQAAEQRAAELSAALQRTQHGLEEMRRQNAGLYLKCRQLQQELTGLRLRVAGMLDGSGDMSPEQALADALGTVEDVRAEQRKLCGEVRAFGRYLGTVLDVLQPSEALRREVGERYAVLVGTCDRLDQLSPSVAGRGGNREGRLESRVLAVNDDLQVVILDAGTERGVRPGTTWRLFKGDKVVSRLRIVEVRRSVSAAVPEKGRLRDIAPGALVRAAE